MIAIDGEPGIGKSRLLDELAVRQRIRVVKACCAPIDRELVFAPIAAIVRSLVAKPDLEAYPALGEIVPELGSSGLPPESARTHALESFARIVVEHAPVLLVIDDLQWADASTITALAYLTRRAEHGVAMVAAARPGLFGEDHALRPALRIALKPLSREVLAPFGERLHERTGGNALFAVELLQAGDSIPKTLQELLLARASATGERAHRALAIASILGRRFDAATLADVLDEPIDALLEQLEVLCKHGLLAVAGEQFEFRHDLIREALYESLSPPRRRRLHERAAGSFVASSAAPGVVAHHAEAAGNVELAIRASLRAAEQARVRWANVEAAAHLERALRLTQQYPDVIEPVAIQKLRIALGRVLVTIGRIGEAETVLAAARADAEQRGDDRELVEIFDALAFARQRGASAPTQALQHAQAALAIAERLGEPDLLVRAHTSVASPMTSLGRLAEAIHHNRAAIEMAERNGKAASAYPIARIALTLHLQGDDRGAIVSCERAEAAARAQHDEESLIMVHWVRALASTALGRYRDAARALDAIRDVGRGEEVFWHARVPNTWGALYSDLCLYDRALACDELSLQSARNQRGGLVREAEVHTLLNIAANRVALGQLAAARTHLAEVRAQVNEVEYARFRWLSRLHAIAAELSAAEGDGEAARQAADSCLALADKYGQARYVVRGKIARAIALGDGAAARTLARAAATLAETHGWIGLAWRAWSIAGDLPQARRAVLACADGLDEPLRSEFLAAVPVRP
jgi:tetratricopeptide (TPR) repeat protein